jgi:hypothetical protein
MEMHNTEFQILKDYPFADAFGQYFYVNSLLDRLNFTGLQTSDASDDLYSTSNPENANVDMLDNIYINSGGSRIYYNVEVYNNIYDSSSTTTGYCIRNKMYVWIVDDSIELSGGGGILASGTTSGVKTGTDDATMKSLLDDKKEVHDCANSQWMPNCWATFADIMTGQDLRIYGSSHGDQNLPNNDTEVYTFGNSLCDWDGQKCKDSNNAAEVDQSNSILNDFPANLHYNMQFSDTGEQADTDGTVNGISGEGGFNHDTYDWMEAMFTPYDKLKERNIYFIVEIQGDSRFKNDWGQDTNERPNVQYVFKVPYSFMKPLYTGETEWLVLDWKKSWADQNLGSQAAYVDIPDKVKAYSYDSFTSMKQLLTTAPCSYQTSGGWTGGDEKPKPCNQLGRFTIYVKAPDTWSDVGIGTQQASFPNEWQYDYPAYAKSPSWIDGSSNIGHSNLNTHRLVDYAALVKWNDSSTTFTNNDVKDFRPVAFAESNPLTFDGTTNTFTFQQYTEQGTLEHSFTSAPNIVNVSFDISKFVSHIDFLGDIETDWEYIEGATGKFYDKIGYKFAIADWNFDMENGSDDDIINQLNNFSDNPGSMYTYTSECIVCNPEILTEGRYIWKDVVDIDGTFNQVSHQYQTPGIKTIKAFVFSYLPKIGELYTGHEAIDVSSFQLLRIKLVTIRIFLDQDIVYVEDFADIGGADFTFIPWPTTTPVIGGIHKSSLYVTSVRDINNRALFSDSQLLSKRRSSDALDVIENGDLGQYPGKMDFGQTRVFTDGNLDLHTLLGIHSDVIETDKFVPATHSHWDGYLNQFPPESSISSIFIDDSEDTYLKSKCIIEATPGSSDGKTIRDTTGNNNVGVLLGDFSIKKTSKSTDIFRDSAMVLPNINTNKDDGAI